MGAKLPQLLQDRVREVRLFMPRWGIVNDRRNQLHEVKRLTGMNIIIDDTDHMLIVKVSSLPTARGIQVFFTVNDEFFQRRQMLTDESGEEFADNPERAIFFARAVLEAVTKQNWMPDVIHCSGWMSALLPLYIKTAYRDAPPFINTKVVFSAFGDVPKRSGGSKLRRLLPFRSLTEDVLKEAGVDFAASDVLAQLALTYSDGFVQGQRNVAKKVMKLAGTKGLPVLEYPGAENLGDAYMGFYEQLCAAE